MIRGLLIAACLAVSGGVRAAGGTASMETRVYRLSATCPLFESSDRDGVTNLQAFFSQEGITFGTGANLSGLRGFSGLTMRNTSAEHEKLARLLQRLDPNTPQIVADFVVVEFRTDELAGATSTNLMALWQAGKGTRVAAAKAVVKSGVNANILDNREEHDPEPADPSELTPLLTPGTFDTREVGLFGSFTPELRPDGKTISLTMGISWSWHSGTNLMEAAYGGEGTWLVSGRASVMQSLDNGVFWFTPEYDETFVLGAPGIPGEPAQPYLFVTFHVIDASGRKPGTSPVEVIAIDGSADSSGRRE